MQLDIIEVNAQMSALETQRNNASNESVRLAGQLTAARTKVKDLEAKNQELKAAADRVPGLEEQIKKLTDELGKLTPAAEPVEAVSGQSQPLQP